MLYIRNKHSTCTQKVNESCLVHNYTRNSTLTLMNKGMYAILDKLILTLVNFIQDSQHRCNDRAESSPTGSLVLSVGSFCTDNFFPCSSLSKSVQKLVDLKPIRLTGSDCYGNKSLGCDNTNLANVTFVSEHSLHTGTKCNGSAPDILSMYTKLHGPTSQLPLIAHRWRRVIAPTSVGFLELAAATILSPSSIIRAVLGEVADSQAYSPAA